MPAHDALGEASKNRLRPITMTTLAAIFKLWFWGVSSVVSRRKSYGYADSLDEAKAAFGGGGTTFASLLGIPPRCYF